ncbi:GANAB [Lepeophtheirus salmonis]|uniref:GANAB n=1 Tax=Lepeophtheirus salmonis TaxID=72036 RepID=A0A7R8HA48_LEPSM|nr:GANAB [Lepeophtheirus salmonis]CAF2970937.1 GANAB [Lepeophtheirus salmonis]
MNSRSLMRFEETPLDIDFHDTKHVYGIPEHADRFSLEDSTGKEPYRLYNLDVFEYERTTGVFWLNAAETWIDIKKSGNGVLDSLAGFVNPTTPSVGTHWMSESGIMDIFVLVGPGPKDDVHDVETKFDKYDIPMDVMWLDIEHTDGKKYFTWDPIKFSDSLGMVNNLTARGRKLVTIVDPHIKKESGYWVHEELTSLGLYTKNRDGSDYEGWCWPGASYYPDFLNPVAQDYFSKQYAFDKYVGSTKDTYTWNDMNEPSVFNGPEITMPKDLIHFGDSEHREIHNMYGHLYVMSTHKGQLMRSENKLRPYILTRSGFAGSQRYASIWTGDNTAEWSHIEASVPMCLSLDGEMFRRWYQAAAFQPFFRSHAHIDTKRREPWLFPNEMEDIRQAIRLRYSYLPLWYTLFYEGEVKGVPPMRPLWYEFPQDEESFGIDKEHLVGDALLVRPFIKEVALLFPRKSVSEGVQKLMANDPYTLVVALDKNQTAEGTLFIDDGESYGYRNGEFLYIKFKYANNRLSSHLLESPGFKTPSWLERVIITGLKTGPNKVTVSSPLIGEIVVEFTYKDEVLKIRKPSPNIAEEWTITLN